MSCLKKRSRQENDLMKRQQELQIEKLQAQNLSSELKAERESINVMRENFKLFPDQMLTSEKEEEYKNQIEELNQVAGTECSHADILGSGTGKPDWSDYSVDIRFRIKGRSVTVYAGKVR